MTMAPLGTSILGQARAGLTTPSGMRTARCTTTPFRLLDFFPRQTDMFVFSFFWGGANGLQHSFLEGRVPPTVLYICLPVSCCSLGQMAVASEKGSLEGSLNGFILVNLSLSFLPSSEANGCCFRKVLWRVAPTALHIFLSQSPAILAQTQRRFFGGFPQLFFTFFPQLRNLKTTGLMELLSHLPCIEQALSLCGCAEVKTVFL